jgi:spore coat protein U-like protein
MLEWLIIWLPKQRGEAVTIHRIRSLRPTLAALLLLAASAPGADAATATGSFTVTGTVSAFCSITTNGMSFTYDPIGANASANASATGGLLTLTCTKGTAPSITLDDGQNAGLASAGTRAMKLGTNNYLGYDIYWPGTTTVWTSANPYVPPVTPSKTARNFTLDGAAIGGQDVAAGTYTDLVRVTVNY